MPDSHLLAPFAEIVIPRADSAPRNRANDARSAGATDLRTAQTLLRDTDLNTTAIYVQVADIKRAEAIDRLDPFGQS
jgi:hypothetical protein